MTDNLTKFRILVWKPLSLRIVKMVFHYLQIASASVKTFPTSLSLLGPAFSRVSVCFRVCLLLFTVLGKEANFYIGFILFYKVFSITSLLMSSPHLFSLSINPIKYYTSCFDPLIFYFVFIVHFSFCIFVQRSGRFPCTFKGSFFIVCQFYFKVSCSCFIDLYFYYFYEDIISFMFFLSPVLSLFYPIIFVCSFAWSLSSILKVLLN